MKTGDVCTKTPRPDNKVEGNKKYYFNSVGKAFMDDGGRVDIVMHAVPINWDGKLVIFFNSESKE